MERVRSEEEVREYVKAYNTARANGSSVEEAQAAGRAASPAGGVASVKSTSTSGIPQFDKLLDDYEKASSGVYNSYNKIAGMSEGDLSDIERFLPRYSERVSAAAEQRSTAAQALRDFLPTIQDYVDADGYQSLLDSLDADDKDVEDMLSALSSMPEYYGQFTNDRDYQIYRQYSPIGYTSEGANTYVQQSQALDYLNQVQNGLIEEERRLRYQNAGQNGTDEVKAQLESVRQQIEDNAQQIYKLSSGLDWIAMGLGKNVIADTRKGIGLSAEAYEQWVNDNKLWTPEQRLGLESLGDSADALDYYNVVDWMHKDKDRDNQIDNIRPTEKWTNEQRATFYNLFAADQETAEGYALRLNNSYAQKSMDEQTAQVRAKGAQLYDGPGGKLLAGVGAASLAIVSAPAKVISWADKMIQTAKSGGNYVQRSTPRITDYADAMVQGRAEQINKDHPTLFGRELGEKGLGDLYQLGISIAQSMVYGNIIGEAGTLGVFFGQAADSAFNEALNRGASAEQAAVYSTLAGMAEVAGEKLSLDNLLNPNNAVFRTWWQNVLISSGIEGSEELVTNGFNRFNDFLSARLTDGQTENQQKIQQLMQNGMSYDNASQKVWTDNVKDAAWDFLGGAISGGVSSGAQYGVRAISPYGGDEYGVSAQRIVSDGREALQRPDGTLDTNNRRLTNLTTSAQRALDNGKPISVGTAASIVRQTNRAALVNATEEQVLKSIDGIDAKDARSLANAIVSKARGETITARYKKLMDQNRDVTNRLVGNLKSPAGTWASGVGVRGIESRKYGDKAAKNMRDAANKVSDSMTVKTGDNQTGTVQEIVYDDNKVPQQLKVKTEDGAVKTVDIKDADLKEGQFDVIKTMTEQDYAADKINSMQNGQDFKSYSDHFETFAEVYGNTASGISFEDAWQAWQNSEIGKDNILTEAQARAAYQAGQDKKVSAKSGLTYRGTGRVSFDEVTDGDDTYEKPSEDEIREFKKTDRYKYLSAVAKAVGVDIVFFRTDAKGINGKYLNGRVYLAINASPSSTSIVEGYVMQTAAHELTHYIRDASPEHYLKLKDFVVKQLIDKGKLGDGTTLADLIRDKQAAYKSSGIEINVGDAIEEVVADACGMVLRDNKMLFELQKSDKALWTQVKAWLGKHLGRIKTAFDGVKAELNETGEMEAVFDELQKLWTEGAVAASKVQVGTQTETGGTEEGFYDDGGNGKTSRKVTDKKTLDFLDNQEHITTYKSMLLVDGKLYPPMAVKVDGKYVDPSVLGQWEEAEERPDLIKTDKKSGSAKFNLNKEKGSPVPAAYNPYMHSSDIVLNDQFTAAYTRNLVTVECEIPVSELTSGYKAEYAKDAVGKHEWHKGPVAGALRKAKGIDRQVYMTRWLKPVRIVPNAEVAQMYKELLDGTNIKVPDNVVPSSLLTELERAGVPIDYTGIAKHEKRGKLSVKQDDLIVLSNNDTDTQNTIMRETHNRMVGEEKIVIVSEETLQKVSEYYPDLRAMRKKERIPILKAKINALKEDLRSYLGILKENSFEFQINGNIIEAKLYDTGVREVMNDVTEEKGSMLFHSSEIFGNAEYMYSMPDYDGDPNIYMWHYFYSPVNIAGSEVGVRIALRDMVLPNEEQIYNWKIKKEVSLGGGKRLPYSGSGPAGTSSDTLDESVPQSKRSVKSDAAESSVSTAAKFSMKSDVEATNNLVAVHNKSLSGLRRMLQRNGVPFPSIAIKKAGTPHEGFGDVSIVFPRSTIDPQASKWNRLYSNDAWTPMEPRTEYDVGDTSKFKARLKEIMGSEIYSDLNAGNSLEDTNLREKLISAEGNIFEALKRNPAVKYAYLKSIGQEPSAGTVEETLDGFGRYKNDQLLEIFKAIDYDTIANATNDSTDTLEQIADILNKHFLDGLPEDKSSLIAAVTKSPIYNASNIKIYAIQDAYRKFKDNGFKVNYEYDKYALREMLDRNRGVENEQGYKDFINSTFDGLIVDSGIANGKGTFTNSGNRRTFKARHIPATLENIVAQMRKEKETGVGAIGTINLRGAATRTYASIEDMREDSGRLIGTHVTDDVYDSYMKGFYERLHALSGYDETAESVFLEAIRDTKTKASMGNYLRKNEQWIDYSPELVNDLWQLKQDIQNMPAPYFEAKPRRVVTPDEALAYIIPDNADADIIDELESRGLNYLTYKAEDSADRLAKLNSVEGAKFSLKQTSAYDQLQAEREARAQERSNERLARQNEILRKRWEYWKGQTKRSKQTLRSRRELRSFTNKLLRDYDSTLDRQSVEKIVQQAADYFVQNDLDAFEKNGMDEAIRGLAEDIVNSADVVLDRDEAELRDRIVDYLRHTSIALSDSDRAEIKHRFGGTAEFRKRGRNSAFRFSPDGRGIDSVYIELQAMFGDIFPEAISNPADRLEYVSDVINNLDEVRGNPFAGSIDEAIDSAAADIYGFVYDTEGSVETTFADREAEKLNRQRQRIEDIKAKAAADKKAAIKKEKEAKWDKVSSVLRKDSAELRELKKQQRQRIEEIKSKAAEDKRSAVQREREAKWNKVSAVRRKYQSMIENSTDRRQRTKVRNKIKRLYSSMVTELTKPTEGRYVPKPLLRLVTDVLNSVTVDGDKGAALKAKVNELNTAYRAMSTGANAIAYDPSIADLVSTLANEINNRGLRELSRQELEDVYNTMKAVQYTVSRATKLVTMEKQKETFEVARSLIRETEKANNVINFAPVRLFLKWTNRPLSFFRRIGGYAQDSSWVMVYNMMDKAQLYQTQLQMEASLIFEDLMKDTESFNAMTDYKQLYDIGLKNRSGDTVPVTMDIALKLYMDTLAEDNARHIAFGGLTVPDIKKYYSGKASAAFAGPGVVEIRPFTSELSELRSRYNNSDIAQEREEIQAEIDELQQRADEWIAELRQNIYKQMGDYEKAWVAAAEKFFNEWSQGVLNEATMRVYGFEKATVPYYVPIHTNPNFRSVSFETISKDMSLENAGFMKSRIEGAKNPILAEGLADIVSWQIDKVARYAAMMPAIRDFNKIYSVSYKSYDTSVQATVANNLHQEGLKYIENWIADLQGARARDSTFFDRLRGNLAAASLTLNPRVALAQTPSYLAAAGVVGYKPLAQALKDVADNPMLANNRDVLQEIAKYSPLMWLRMNGYFDESVKDMRENKTVASKLNKRFGYLTNWIQTMDGLTVGQLWYAAQYWVEDNTDLERGSEEFMQRSAEMFNRIIEETQPNYTVNQRPDILREPNAVVKQLTMFMTQRLQNLNILYDAVGTYNATVRENRATGVSEERLREAKLGLARAASSQIASAAMIVCFKLVADALMYSMKGYRDDDKELTKASVVNTLLGNFAETLAGNFLFGQEIYDVVKSMITGETYYGVSLAGVETFTDVITDFVKLTNSPSNEQLWRLCKSFTQMLGIPMNNIEKLYNAVRYRIEDAKEGNSTLDFASEISLTDDQRVKKMYNAYVKGDTNTVKKLTEEIGSKAAANSSMASYIRSMFSAGRLTEAEAVEQLRKFAGASRHDAEHDILKLRCEKETGHKYDELKELYQAGDISKSDAVKWRSMYGDMPTEDTEKEVQQWTLKVDTGYDYDNLKTLLFDDDITEKQAIEWSVKYGMQEEDDATAKVRKWMCEKETGYTYDDLMEHAEGGDITLDQALDWMVEYGKLTDNTVHEVEAFYSGGAITKDKLISLYKDHFEYDDLKANEVADKREFVGLNTRINDISKQTVKDYNKYCAVLDIDHDLYYDAWKEIGQLKGDVDERGKSIAGSKVKKAFAYIDTLPLTSAQKSALYMALYDNPKEDHFTKYDAPWVR